MISNCDVQQPIVIWTVRPKLKEQKTIGGKFTPPAVASFSTSITDSTTTCFITIFSRDPKEFADIYGRGVPAKDPSLYLAVLSRTDPSQAPEGCESLYILVHTAWWEDQTWEGPGGLLESYRNTIIEKLKTAGGMPDIEEHIVVERALTRASKACTTPRAARSTDWPPTPAERWLQAEEQEQRLFEPVSHRWQHESRAGCPDGANGLGAARAARLDHDIVTRSIRWRHWPPDEPRREGDRQTEIHTRTLQAGDVLDDVGHRTPQAQEAVHSVRLVRGSKGAGSSRGARPHHLRDESPHGGTPVGIELHRRLPRP